MRYLLLLHVDESGFGRLSPAEQVAGMERYRAFNETLAMAGALVATGRLTPADASTQIRTIGGKVVPMDGPYAESKEQIAGFYLIEAPDRATALALAAQCPAVGHGAVEVREVRG
jgi:hypothetical protein